jgi:ABC-type xylose transport system permease subunit
VGIALLAVMQNGFDTLQIDPFYQYIIKGSVLVLAIAWDEYVSRKKFRAAF